VEGFTKAELIKKIKTGVPESQRDDPKGPAPMIRMPAWGEALDESELDAVASYLLSLTPGEQADF
ncbi:MAG: cytochrome c, partial [Elusimicrobia bacterium]|nr:cytochrome c [Elusimicrobiota bacterium]